MFLLKIYFNHQTYFYNFEACKFHFLNIKKYKIIDFFCILRVTEDFGKDLDPHPDPPYQNVTDP
jgi:hypothetical protein